MKKSSIDLQYKLIKKFNGSEVKLPLTEEYAEQLLTQRVNSSFIRPMTKACKICFHYDKENYPKNKTCLSCGLFKDGSRLKYIELYREESFTLDDMRKAFEGE